ncbi:hypothetical protein FOA52_003620 [Chlamydomonas sp. UWO 241]|nr:hypothetical protein FOA52_003620 [Chlamydomonas sp. UWO 241]
MPIDRPQLAGVQADEVAELKVEVDIRDGKPDWTPEDMVHVPLGLPQPGAGALRNDRDGQRQGCVRGRRHDAEQGTAGRRDRNRHALNETVENEEVGVAGVTTQGRKKVVAMIGWVNGSSEYPRSGSEVSKGDCMFLVVTGCDTHNVPEFAAIVRAREGVSIESGMPMVPVRFESVYAEVAFELCALAANGVGAMAVDAIDWSAVTACSPSARTATWDDAYGAMVGAEVEWPAVGLLFTNSRKISAAAALSARVNPKGV